MGGDVGEDGSTQRQGLDRRRILLAAIEFIDEQGLHALTMRRLGAHLGVEAMALYRYVPSREDLLDGVVDTVLDALHRDPEVHLHARHGWQNYLQRLAHGIRRIALDHPAVFPLIVTRPPSAPWIRPPLRSLRWLESFFTVWPTPASTTRRPWSPTAPTRRSCSATCCWRCPTGAAGSPRRATRRAPPPAPPRDVGLADYPHLRELESLLDQDETVTEFEEALEGLLDRLDALHRGSVRR